MLDESVDVVATVAPWTSVVILTSIPYRFAQALFVDRLIEAGGDATRYGNILGETANLILITFVLALCGRAVFARACRLAAARGRTPGREAWRVPPVALASYLFTGSLALLIWMMAAPTIAGLIPAVMFAGLAIGTIELNEQVGIRPPLRVMGRFTKRIGIPFALTFVFFVSFIVAIVNVATMFQAGVWLASALGGFDAPHWDVLFGFTNRRFNLLVLAGALVAVEPFWIATNVMFVRKAGAEETGEDIRIWFEELREAS